MQTVEAQQQSASAEPATPAATAATTTTTAPATSCFKSRGDGGPDAQQNKETVKTDREGQQARTDSGSTQGSREAVKADRSDRQAVNPASVAVKAAAKAGVAHRGWQQQLHYCYIKFVDVASYLKP